jgi:uncharacterized phiE125 gp8 family phage protein
MQGLICTAAPAAEPVSVVEAQAHLRLDGDAETDVLAALIAGAREVAELMTGRALVTQSWTLSLDAWSEGGAEGAVGWPAGLACAPRCARLAFALPRPPLISVETVKTFDADGVGSVWDPAAYFVDRATVPGRIVRLRGAPWPIPGRPLGGLEIAFTAGYGDAATVPAALRQAILLLVAHWFENREPVPPRTIGTPVPAAVYGLLAPYRVRGL